MSGAPNLHLAMLLLTRVKRHASAFGKKNWGGGQEAGDWASLLRALKWVRTHWWQANYLAMASTRCPSGLSSLKFWQYEFTYIQSRWRKTCWRFPGFPYIKLCSEFLDNFEIRNLITAFFTNLEDERDWGENSYFYHINCSALQGFPPLRKTVSPQVKNYDNFSCVWDQGPVVQSPIKLILDQWKFELLIIYR